MEILISALTVAIFFLWLRVRDLEGDARRDYAFLEWWMRSMEERKADKEVWEEESVDE